AFPTRRSSDHGPMIPLHRLTKGNTLVCPRQTLTTYTTLPPVKVGRTPVIALSRLSARALTDPRKIGILQLNISGSLGICTDTGSNTLPRVSMSSSVSSDSVSNLVQNRVTQNVLTLVEEKRRNANRLPPVHAHTKTGLVRVNVQVPILEPVGVHEVACNPTRFCVV